jgi:hypothetical protein
MTKTEVANFQTGQGMSVNSHFFSLFKGESVEIVIKRELVAILDVLMSETALKHAQNYLV